MFFIVGCKFTIFFLILVAFLSPQGKDQYSRNPNITLPILTIVLPSSIAI